MPKELLALTTHNMTLEQTKKLNAHIFRLLKVNEIVIPIGRTNKGNLGLKFQANSDDFEVYLDAVPLSTKSILEDDNNIDLKKMIEKYFFEEEIEGFKFTDTIVPSSQSPSIQMADLADPFAELKEIVDDSTTEIIIETAEGWNCGREGCTADYKHSHETFPTLTTKKRGRPAGVKNKVKA